MGNVLAVNVKINDMKKKEDTFWIKEYKGWMRVLMFVAIVSIISSFWIWGVYIAILLFSVVVVGFILYLIPTIIKESIEELYLIKTEPKSKHKEFWQWLYSMGLILGLGAIGYLIIFLKY